MTDGISKLGVAQKQFSESAGSELEKAADKQQSNVASQQSLRATQSTFESFVKDSSSTVTANKSGARFTADAVVSQAFIAKPAMYLDQFSKSNFNIATKHSPAALSKSLTEVISSPKHYASGLKSLVEALKQEFAERSKGLEGDDRMGNFEIQQLMSDFNEAASLATSTKKKTDDQLSSNLGKI